MVQHSIQDFDKFTAAFDEHRPIREEHGQVSDRVYRSTANPNDVTVLLEFKSEAGAKAMLADPRLAAAMDEATVSNEPLILLSERIQPAGG